jgi:hypothetical protein
MTDRDDVPVHADHEPQKADHETTSQTPPSAVVMAEDPAADSPVGPHGDEQPYFLIDSGQEGAAEASPEPGEPAAEQHASPAAEPEAANVEAKVPEQTGFGFAEEPDTLAAAPAAVAADEDENELPEDLRALNEMLDRPTAEIMPISADTAEEAAASAVGEDTQPAAESTDEATAPAETVQAEGSALDDIAPGTVAGAQPEVGEAEAAAPAAGEPEAVAELSAAAAEAAMPEGVATKVSWWPFVGYMVVWLGAAGYAVWQLQMLPTGQAAYESDFYSQTMLGGLVLLGVGPALLLVVWLASWIGRKGAKIGSMFISALIKGATATLFGAVVWMGALMLIDYLRLGRPF